MPVGCQPGRTVPGGDEINSPPSESRPLGSPGRAGITANRVLLADDQVVMREGLRALLEREGFDVVGEATDGREACRLARELSPDIAILDLAMPLMNGIETGRAILRGSPGVRTIALTVHTE